MLRCKVICDPCVIDNGSRNDSFLAGPWQCRIGRQKKSETTDCNQSGDDYESNGLRSQKQTISFGAISEISAAQAVTNPKESGEREVKQVKGARLWIGVTMDKPKRGRDQPDSAEHPETVPR